MTLPENFDSHKSLKTRAFRGLTLFTAVFTVAALTACATTPSDYRGPYETRRDKTAKGAGVGAAAGAAAAYAKGKREGDELLAGAAIGALVGGSVGAYLDAQEERLARIPGTTVERVSPDTLKVRFDSDVLFQVDSSQLSGSARSNIGQVAQVMVDFPKTSAVIHGHTDASGSESHNQDLSERRAKAVNNTLVDYGVSPARLTALGSGESQPIASNDTASGRSLNRRVEIFLRARAK